MGRNKTAVLPRQDQAPVTMAEWFAGRPADPVRPGIRARVLTEKAAATPGTLRVFERAAAAEQDADEDTVWLTMLPGFPDGSHGWAQVDRILGVGSARGCTWSRWGKVTDKPWTTRTPPSSARTRRGAVAAPRRAPHRRRHLRLHLARAARAAASPAGADHIWRHRQASDRGRAHGERRPVRRRAHPPVADHAGAAYTAGRTGDAAGAALAARVRGDDSAGAPVPRGYRPALAELAELRSAITRRDGAAFLHNAAGFVSEHRRNARRWDSPRSLMTWTARLSSTSAAATKTLDEHRQIPAVRERVPQAEIPTFPAAT